MTPIFDVNDILSRRLSQKQQFSIHEHESVGEIEHLLRRKAACSIADMIIKEPAFFKLDISAMYGTLRTDAFIFTESEITALLRDRFDAGLNHARGFMPMWEKK